MPVTLVAIVGKTVEGNVTFYRIMVREGGQERIIHRRYTEFADLDKALEVYSWLLRPPLPPRHQSWFGAEKFQQERQDKLDKYLVAIVHQAQPLDRIPELRLFLEAKPRSSPSDASARSTPGLATESTVSTSCASTAPAFGMEDASSGAPSSSSSSPPQSRRAASKAGGTASPPEPRPATLIPVGRRGELAMGQNANEARAKSESPTNRRGKRATGTDGRSRSLLLPPNPQQNGTGSANLAAGRCRQVSASTAGSSRGTARRIAASQESSSCFSWKCCLTGVGMVAVLICLGQVLPESAEEIFGDAE